MVKYCLIYGLYHNDELRYIGRTSQSLDKRLRQHLCLSAKHNSHLGYWLRSLPNSPSIRLIKKCKCESSIKEEAKTINDYFSKGINLVNSMKPKNINGLLQHSEESKRKIGVATKRIHAGMKRSKETKEKIRIAALNRQRKPTPWLYTEEVREKSSMKLRKPIKQYCLEGNLIREWDSATTAAKTLGFNKGNIGMCCKGKLITSSGYIWKYQN
jgi:hypothetical protein